MKKLQLNTFKQLGIDNKIAMDCFDTPLAYASSYYNPDYYFCYFLITHLYNNWELNKFPFEKAKNNILVKLGLKMSSDRADSKENFNALIRKKINNNNPVFIVFDYYNMFFEPDHYLKEHIPHGTIITAYEEDKKRFVLQDGAHMQFEGLYPLYLTEDIVYDIWEKSNTYFKQNVANPYYNRIFYITKNDKINPKTLPETLEYFLLKGIQKENNLIHIIKENDISVFKGFFEQMNLRRDFYIAHEMMFNVLKKIIETEKIIISNDELNDFIIAYLTSRDAIISKIIKTSLKGKIFDQENILEWTEIIRNFDTKLFDIIQRIVDQVRENGIINYALNCKTWASSESNYDNIQFLSSKAVNGYIGENDFENIWASNNTDAMHWIIFDLKKKTQIKTLVLVNFKDNYLEDFMIQGSNDAEFWDDIIIESNNNNKRNFYRGLALNYRYFRLYITKTSSGDWACLQEFEAWG